MRKRAIVFLLLTITGCGDGAGTVVVNSLLDLATPPAGTMTLRAALEQVEPGGKIDFDPTLDGGTIELSIVGATNSVLRGEVFVMNKGHWEFQGFQERDYGKSALYAAKSLTIDASGLRNGITLDWAGGDANPARVLAVYGNLTMRNVRVSSGHAAAEATGLAGQPYTLARGGGLAVWGLATLEHCTLAGNRVEGDRDPSRDRGAFGGGIYANRVVVSDSVVSGNSVRGYGAAGGGIYSVGGVDTPGRGSLVTRSAISGNRVEGQHSYGGGIYSDGGGPGNNNTLEIESSTIARNLAADNPDLDQVAMFQYYYRGGGVYMSNGSLAVTGCTIVENQVSGHPATFNGKPNMGGGAIAATIGDAHVVEDMKVAYSILAGNSVNGATDDLYTGSLLNFYSLGYNLIGRLDASQILVPIPVSFSLSRKHWPKSGDLHGVDLADVVELGAISDDDSIESMGADAGANAVLYYPPAGSALDRVPPVYDIDHVLGQYEVIPGNSDDFPQRIVDKLRNDYGDLLGQDFGAGLGDLSAVHWYGPAVEWPSNPENAEWIQFWRDIDAEIGDALGPGQLDDGFWGSFASGRFGDGLIVEVQTVRDRVSVNASDQLGEQRAAAGAGDAGAIELAN